MELLVEESALKNYNCNSVLNPRESCFCCFCFFGFNIHEIYISQIDVWLRVIVKHVKSTLDDEHRWMFENLK